MTKKKLNFFNFFISVFIISQIVLAVAFLNIIPLEAADLNFATDPVDFTPQVSIPGSDFTAQVPTDAGSYNAKTGNMSSNLLASYVISFYNYGLAFSGILATLVLMGAGLIWLTSGGDSGKITQAKKLISGAIIGLLILVCAWMILNTINPNLTRLSNIEVSVVKKQEISAISCCSSVSGNVVVPVDVINGKRVFASGENKGKPIKCGNGTVECGKGQSCIISGTNNAFSCIDTSKYECCQYDQTLKFNTSFCFPISKGAPCPPNDVINKLVTNGATYHLETRLSTYCSLGTDDFTCKTTSKNLGESCGNEGGTCYSTCPKNNEQDSGGSACKGDLKCCMPIEANTVKGDCTGHADGSECAQTSDYCYGQVCLTGKGKVGERCGIKPGSICKMPANINKTGTAPHDERDVVNGGRECEANLSCYYSVNSECGLEPGAKCIQGLCPDDLKHSGTGSNCPTFFGRCCYVLK